MRHIFIIAFCFIFFSSLQAQLTIKSDGNNRFGLQDVSGKLVLPIEYDGIDTLPFGFFKVNRLGLNAFYSPKSKSITPIIFNQIIPMRDGTFWGNSFINSRYSRYNESGRFIKEQEYDYVEMVGDGAYFRAIKNEKAFVLNSKGVEIMKDIDFYFGGWGDDAGEYYLGFREAEHMGCFSFKNHPSYGLISYPSLRKLSSKFIPVGYEDRQIIAISEADIVIFNMDFSIKKKINGAHLEYYGNGLIRKIIYDYQNNKEKQEFLDLEGNEVPSPKNNRIEYPTQRFNVFRNPQSNLSGVKNLAGEEIIPAIYNYISTDLPYIYLQKDGKNGVADTTGKIICPIIWERIYWKKELQVFELSNNSHHRFMDINGKMTFPADNDDIGQFLYKNYYTFGKNNLWGVASIEGEVVLPLIYKSVRYMGGKIWANSKEAITVFDQNFKEIKTLPLGSLFHGKDTYFTTRNGKMGLVDYDEHIILPFDMDTIYPNYYGSLTVKRKGKIGFIRWDLSVIIPIEYESILLGKNNQWPYVLVQDGWYILPDGDLKPFLKFKADSAVFFEGNLCKIWLKGQSFLYDFVKKSKIPLNFEKVELSQSSNFLYIMKDQKVYLFNRKTERMLTQPIQSPYFGEEGHRYYGVQFYSNYLVVEANEKRGLISENGDIILPFEYDAIKVGDSAPFVLDLTKNEKHGLYNVESKLTLTPEFDGISYQEVKDIYIVYKNGLQGILDRNFKWILPVAYEQIQDFGSYWKVIKDGHFGIYSLKNGEIMPCKYKQIDFLTNAGLTFSINEENLIEIWDKNFQKIVTPNFSYLSDSPYSGYAISQNMDFYGLIDSTGFEIIKADTYNRISFVTPNFLILEKKQVQFVSQLDNSIIENESEAKKLGFQNVSYSLKSTFDFVDLYGKKLMNNDFDFIDDFRDLGTPIVVGKEGKYGFLLTNGQMSTSLEYDFLEMNSNFGLIAAKKNGKWGYLDTMFKVAIPFQFDYADQFNLQRLAIVLKNGKYQWIDTKGLILKDFDFKNEIKFERILRINQLPNEFCRAVTDVQERIILPKTEGASDVMPNGLVWFGKSIDKTNTCLKSYGVMNLNGEQITAPFCENINFRPFDYYKYAKFSQNKKWGICDLLGNVIVNAIYDNIEFTYLDEKDQFSVTIDDITTIIEVK
jgi:WG containing repeat